MVNNVTQLYTSGTLFIAVYRPIYFWSYYYCFILSDDGVVAAQATHSGLKRISGPPFLWINSQDYKTLHNRLRPIKRIVAQSESTVLRAPRDLLPVHGH